MDAAERLAQLERLAAAAPDDHLTLFLLGRELLRAGRPDDAAAALARCRDLAPDYTAAWRFLGDALRAAGRHDDARDAYARGIEVSERTGDLQTGREMRALLARLSPRDDA